MISVSAAMLYALGWTFATMAYSALHVNAEDVGVDFDYLLVRTSVLVAGLVVALGLALLVTRLDTWRVRGLSGDLSAFRLLFLIGRLLLAGLVGVLMWVFVPWPSDLWVRSVFIGAASAAVLVIVWFEGALLLMGSGFTLTDQAGPGLSGVDSRQLVAASSIWVVTLVLLAAGAGTVVGQQISDGHEIDLLLFRALYVDAVVQNATETTHYECVISLGAHDGVAVLYDPLSQSVLRIASVNLSLTRRLSESGTDLDHDCEPA